MSLDSHENQRTRRVAYVITSLAPLCTFIMREIEELCRRGWSIDIFLLKRPGKDSIRSSGKVRVHYLPYLLSVEVVSATFTYGVRRPLDLLGLIWLLVSRFCTRPSLLIRNLSILPKCLAYATDVLKSDIPHIHAHWATVSTTAAMVVSKVSGLPFSFTAHAWDIFSDTTLLSEKIHRAEKVVTCTRYNKDYLKQFLTNGVSDQKIVTVYHGLQLGQYERKAPTSPSRTFRILTVGKWAEKKGFHVLIEALSKLSDDKNWNLQIVGVLGRREYRNTVCELIRKNHLQSQIEVLSDQPHSRVVELMRESDLFVLPCIVQGDDSRDGIPNVLIESLAVELPVVSTEISGIPELVLDGLSGRLVSPNDPDALAEVIRWCRNHPAELRELGRNGRRRVGKHFDISKNVEMLEKVLLNRPLDG